MTKQNPLSPRQKSQRTRTHTWSSPYDIFVQETLPVPASPPTTVSFQGRQFIPPKSDFARAVIMGNTEMQPAKQQKQPPSRQQRPISNLSALLNQEQGSIAQQTSTENVAVNPSSRHCSEADSASGPQPTAKMTSMLGSSAPSHLQHTRTPLAATSTSDHHRLMRQHSSGAASAGSIPRRRCLSSKELMTLAPPSGSPYAYILFKKEQLEQSMRERFQAIQGSAQPTDFESSSTSSRRREGSNQMRNRRRAKHNQAVVDDLCNVVADLFIAESKLLKPLQYGVLQSDDKPSPSSGFRDQVVRSIHNFIAALPARYALGVETPSEVLLHMRLLAAARSDRTKAVVHIHNLDDEDGYWKRAAATISTSNDQKTLRLVTISCNDAVGLLEYITRLLATGGSRVLDADVMLSADGIVLDRFIVDMNGRLRLDRLANLIEIFVREKNSSDEQSGTLEVADEKQSSQPGVPSGGPLYYKISNAPERITPPDINEEMQSAIPLTEVLASSGELSRGLSFPKLRKMHSMPGSSSAPQNVPNIHLPMRRENADQGTSISQPLPPGHSDGADASPSSPLSSSTREKRPLVNRRASSNLDEYDSGVAASRSINYMTIPSYSTGSLGVPDRRTIPLIPFEELMLIETLGTGRVSTIYRAAWQRPAGVQMVALKVAMANNITGDTSNVDELRREADIAARLKHPNICDLVGVAADEECFCLAYDFCEGGSLLSLLSDTSRYYEYLPVALDIANGMAYLHSRNIIHRDLKPSNILLTRDHRAKIADFGMSVANTGQELTAETGTYRYMSPEVIRHESYSSNADVYSFGICLWQLITREVPFATMTPIQAAYAVAEGTRPPIPPSTPRRLQEIMIACWDEDSHKRPSFTYIAMALADYAKMAFSPANVGALTLQIANEMLANVEGNSTVNVDFSTPVSSDPLPYYMNVGFASHDNLSQHGGSAHSDVGLEIE